MSVLKTVGARSPHHPGRTPEGPEMWQTRRIARWQWCRSYQSLSLCTSRHITFLSRCLVSYFQVVSFALSDGEQARIPQQLHPHMERYRSQHRPTYTYVCLCGRDNALINTTTSEKTGDQGGPHGVSDRWNVPCSTYWNLAHLIAVTRKTVQIAN
jgi:hypothetical protein